MEEEKKDEDFRSEITRSQTQQFEFDDDVRRVLREQGRTMHNRQVKMNLFYFVVGTVLYFGCKHFGALGIKEGNYYTINHVEFNTLVLRTYAIVNGLQLILHSLVKNCGCRTRVKCLDLTWAFICILIRLCIFALIAWQFTYFFKCLRMAWHLDHKNWWRSPDEPWFSGASLFNSAVCWWTWFMCQMVNWLLIFYGTIIVIAVIGGYFKKGWMACQQIGELFTQLFVAGWSYFKSSLLGRSYDEIILELTAAVLRMSRGPEDESDIKEKAEREKFINKERQGFGKLLFDRERDCPICLMEFKDSDQVVALACSKEHVYHTACIDELLASPHVKNECSLCRASIMFNEETNDEERKAMD